jgi:hypothetical protein
MPGDETRSNILPIMSPFNSPAANYNPGDQLPNPAQLGISREGTLGMVMKSFGGLGYYMDMIGFGQKSTNFSIGNPYPMGASYFMQTGATCDNGANMWYFVNGIPDGSALGKNVQQAIKQMGLPELKGLAPGIIEDSKSALDPRPIMSAMFTQGYPKCVKLEKPVGDFNGAIQNGDGGYYVDDVSGVYYNGRTPMQSKWVQATDAKGNPIFIDQKAYDCTPKAFSPSGKRLDPSKVPALDPSCYSSTEGFLTEKQQTQFIKLGAALLLAGTALFIVKMKKR